MLLPEFLQAQKQSGGSDAVILSILKSSGENMTRIFILSINYMHVF